MYDELFSRFRDEVRSSIEDPDIHLSYTDRQRLKEGEYAQVAKEKLPTLTRRIWRIKIGAVVAGVLLAAGAVVTALYGMDLNLWGWTLNDFSFLLFVALCMGVFALGGMGRMLKLEKQRLLCELAVAYSEEDGTEVQSRAPG